MVILQVPNGYQYCKTQKFNTGKYPVVNNFGLIILVFVILPYDQNN